MDKGILMPDSSRLRPREKRDRKATEQAIVDAFETVVLRDGVAGLGINAVAQEAGVNKVLIYRYFQDMPGLARHWASVSSFWPSELELIGNDPDAFARLPVRERVRVVLCNYFDAIRSRPRTIEMMAGELLSPTETTRALSDGMVRPGQAVSDYIQLDTADTDITDRVWKLIYVVNAFVAFLAIRERNNPSYMGLDLTDDESWQYLRDTVAGMTDSFLKD
jgi:AcrR family transcriptional regulator